jgi:ABC-type multidrug transport system fused ATPase/permease subunit
MKSFIEAIKLVKDARSRLILLLVIGIVGSAAVSLRNYLFGSVINAVIEVLKSASPNISMVVVPLSVLIVAGVLFAIFDTADRHYSNQLNVYLEASLRQKAYQKLDSLSIDFFETNRPGGLLRRVNNGINAIINMIFNFTYNFVSPIGLVIFGVIGLAFISWWFVVIALLTLVINTYLFLIAARKAEPLYDKSNRMGEEADGILSESFSHTTTVRSLSATELLGLKYARLIEKASGVKYRENKIWRNSIMLRSLISTLSYSLGIVLAVYLAFSHQISIGSVVVANVFLNQVIGQALALGRFLDTAQGERIKIRRLISLFDTKTNFADRPDAKELAEPLSKLEFDSVGFEYSDGQKGIVQNISLRIGQDTTIALVGPSGVGKSTITKLILRFYEPTAGDILINGKPVANYTQNSLRQHMAIVMQDVMLFNATIIENIGIAKAGSTEQEIIAAAKKAHADEFIQDLPKGYDTLVGERGIKLSGGQRQRVAIARAILKDPDLIILDEATSALDSQSEAQVQAGLQELLKGRMALIIAHRLSTVRHADEILVMERGKVVERGNHAELIKKDGLYKQLFDMQSATGKIEL